VSEFAALFPMESTAAEAQRAIAEEFAFFSDWSERYQYLIDLGRKLPPFPESCKTDEHRLHGCQSIVWIVPSGRRIAPGLRGNQRFGDRLGAGVPRPARLLGPSSPRDPRHRT
jgi:hypothetical protein